jgi:hypothetical protein
VSARHSEPLDCLALPFLQPRSRILKIRRLRRLHRFRRLELKRFIHEFPFPALGASVSPIFQVGRDRMSNIVTRAPRCARQIAVAAPARATPNHHHVPQHIGIGNDLASDPLHCAGCDSSACGGHSPAPRVQRDYSAAKQSNKDSDPIGVYYCKMSNE